DTAVERPAAAPVRLDPDGARDPPDQLPANVEAEPRAADATCRVGIEPIELLEDTPLLRRWDPETLIGDGEAEIAVCRLEPERDVAAVRGVLDRVVDDVREHLAKLSLVGRDRGDAFRRHGERDGHLSR